MLYVNLFFNGIHMEARALSGEVRRCMKNVEQMYLFTKLSLSFFKWKMCSEKKVFLELIFKILSICVVRKELFKPSKPSARSRKTLTSNLQSRSISSRYFFADASENFRLVQQLENYMYLRRSIETC